MAGQTTAPGPYHRSQPADEQIGEVFLPMPIPSRGGSTSLALRSPATTKGKSSS